MDILAEMLGPNPDADTVQMNADTQPALHN
jgi:hypothetical protein